MPTREVVFAGPTVTAEEVRAILPGAQVLGPVKADDLLRLDLDAGDRVGIVDGYFRQVPAVRHKEILSVLDRGVDVYGAASMGALRAAELDVFGMRGVGRVYGDYTTGAIDGDDEVAVPHAPAEDGYVQLSEAMVNIRHNCERAVAAGVLTPGAAGEIVAVAKETPFFRRTWFHVLRLAQATGTDTAALAALRLFVREHRTDIKRRDAVALLQEMKAKSCTRGDGPPAQPFRLQTTTFLASWRRQNTGRETPRSGFVTDTEVLNAFALFDPGFVPTRRRVAVEACAAVAAGSRPDAAPRSPRRIVLGRFRRRHGITGDAQYTTWLDERCMSEEELLGLLRQKEALASAGVPPWEDDGDRPPTRALELVRELFAAAGTRRTGDLPAATAKHWFSAEELTHLPEGDRWALLVARNLALAPGIQWEEPVIWHLKARGVFRAGLRVAERAAAVNRAFRDSHPGFTVSQLSASRVAGHFRRRWGYENGTQEAFDLALADRGLHTREALVLASRPFYLLDRTIGVPDDLGAHLPPEIATARGVPA